jgi:hypothetical protein
VLGEGAYGKAYLAQHKMSRLHFVIKQIDLNNLSDRDRE